MSQKLKTSLNTNAYNVRSKSKGRLSSELIVYNDSPFLIKNLQRYKKWREKKLSHFPLNLDKIMLKIDNLDRITEAEKCEIVKRCAKYNMAIYQLNEQSSNPDKLKSFAQNFGLKNLDQHFCRDNDGITALKVSKENNKGGFIPYSDRALNWHTDGYYNAQDSQVYAVLLHCQSPASEGGENWFYDHEMAYLRLRDENPDYIEALMHPNTMTIPPHIENGEIIRAEQSGPVFSTYNQGENIHMRYSQRSRNIVWRDDDATKAALAFLNQLLNEKNKDALNIKLKAGEGIICNNVLHNRSAFNNTAEQSRLMYRGRFFEPVS